MNITANFYTYTYMLTSWYIVLSRCLISFSSVIYWRTGGETGWLSGRFDPHSSHLLCPLLSHSRTEASESVQSWQSDFCMSICLVIVHWHRSTSLHTPVANVLRKLYMRHIHISCWKGVTALTGRGGCSAWQVHPRSLWLTIKTESTTRP